MNIRLAREEETFNLGLPVPPVEQEVLVELKAQRWRIRRMVCAHSSTNVERAVMLYIEEPRCSSTVRYTYLALKPLMKLRRDLNTKCAVIFQNRLCCPKTFESMNQQALSVLIEGMLLTHHGSTGVQLNFFIPALFRAIVVFGTRQHHTLAHK